MDAEVHSQESSATAKKSGNGTPGPDPTILHPPRHVSRQGVQQILQCMTSGTPQVRRLLLQEADVIFECRICKSLFRGLINFIDHKKKYCTKEALVENRMSSPDPHLILDQIYSLESEAAVYIEPTSPEEIFENFGNKRGVGKAPEQKSLVVLRRIPNTTQALEQQVLSPEQIINRADIDDMSLFSHQKDYNTTKLIGEITLKQARKAKNPTHVDKRQFLHDLLKKCSNASEGGSGEESNDSLKVALPAKSPGQKQAKTPELPPFTGDSLKVTAPKKSPAVSKEPSTMTSENECKICKKKCKNWTALAWHLRIHKRPIFKCPLCRYSSVSPYTLRRHLHTTHNMSPKQVDQFLNIKLESQVTSDTTQGCSNPVPTCPVCEKSFASRRNVLRHMQIHRRENDTNSCKSKEKITPLQPNKEEIARNKAYQIMDEKRLVCRKCNKTLSSMRRLHQHVCNHFGLNRYRCKSCPYENSDYTQMRRHIMGKHGRQFRTIQQIAAAIKSMKVGTWITFNNTDDDNHENSSKKTGTKETSKLTQSKDIKLHSKDIKLSPKDGKPPKETKTPAKEKEQKMTGGKDKEVKSQTPVKESKVTGKGKKDKDEEEDGNQVSFGDDDEQHPNSPEEAMDTTDMSSHGDQENTTPQKITLVINPDDIPSTSTAPSPTTATSYTSTPKKIPDPSTYSQDTAKRQLRVTTSPRGSASGKGEADSEVGTVERSLMETMMDKKNIKCLTCNKKYHYLSSLQRHVRWHLLSNDNDGVKVKTDPDASSRKQRAIEALINVNQLKCLKCRKRFTTMASLKRHVGRHLGYSTFQCKFCGYVCRNYTWFKQHLISKHTTMLNNVDEIGSLICTMKTQ